MNCPGCDVEMADPEGGTAEPLRVCAECGGMTVELVELNPILLRHGLPGMESLRGRVVPDGDVGECPECRVDMTLFESGDRQDPDFYEVCEECGRVFIAGGSLEADLAPEKQVVDFFRRFAPGKPRPRP